MDENVKEVYEAFGKVMDMCEDLEDEDTRLACELAVLDSKSTFVQRAFEREVK